MCSFAAKRQLLAAIVPERSPDGVHTPASPYDTPFRAFTEQLQRIADQLSMAIEGLIAAAAAEFWIRVYVTRRTGVIHGDQYEILDQFSKVIFFSRVAMLLASLGCRHGIASCMFTGTLSKISRGFLFK